MDLQNIGPLTQKVVDSFLQKLQEPDTKKIMKKHIIGPFISHLVELTAGYIWTIIFMYVLIVVLLIIILYKVW